METTKRLRSEVDATVYCGTKDGFKRTTSVDGVAIVPCFSTDVLFPLDNWFFNRTLSGAADMIKADVYEAHTVSGYGFLNAIRKRKITKPFIQTIHGVLADEYVQSFRGVSPTFRARFANLIMWRLSKIEGESARNATLVVTVSQYSSEKIVQFYGVDDARIRIVTNGVDTQRFRPAQDPNKIKHQIGISGRQCVLFVGKLIPRKGLTFLAEAAKHVVKERSGTVFVVVGNGPLRNHVISHLEKTNLLSNFVFLGDVNEDALAALYNCADVFAFPSLQEGLGIVLLEAQATAKPVVAFDVGGVREAVLNKETGLLIRPDSRELADVILRLLSDQSLREQMGRRGRAFVSQNFSWDVCAQRMLKVYYEALSSTGQD